MGPAPFSIELLYLLRDLYQSVLTDTILEPSSNDAFQALRNGLNGPVCGPPIKSSSQAVQLLLRNGLLNTE